MSDHCQCHNIYFDSQNDWLKRKTKIRQKMLRQRGGGHYLAEFRLNST